MDPAWRDHTKTSGAARKRDQKPTQAILWLMTTGDGKGSSPPDQSPATTPRNDWELEGPAHLGAPFVAGNLYRTSTQSAIRGLVLLAVVAVVAFAAAINSGSLVAIALGAVLLVATLSGFVLMIRLAVRAEMQTAPREPLEQRRLRRASGRRP